MKSEENDMETNELPDELVSIRHINTYTVPSDYFDALAEDIASKVYLPLAADTPLPAPPVNYFDELADTILLKIKNASAQSEVQKELEEIEPLLTTISKTNVYRVPDGYFDTFKIIIPAVKKPASVIKMRRSKTWWSYAAAAVVAGVVAITVVSSVEKNRQGEIRYTQALAKVSDNDLSNYLDQTSHDADIVPISQNDNDTISGEGIFKILLNDVSDTELENYLNENNDSDEKNIKGI